VATLELPVAELCGQLLLGGFDGAELPARYEAALREGRRAGATLFRRNLPSVAAAADLCGGMARAAGTELPPFIAIDQEGGRVGRLPAPALKLPPMRELGRLGDLALVRRAARAVATELGALGFNLNFAPVLDVDSNALNPVIGDRSFGPDPRTVMRCGVAYLRGLQDKNVLACGKHFPGHGDTEVDSHVNLPVIRHDRKRLDQVELPPFRAAIGAGVASLMTTHVVVEALDPAVPATLSRAVCASLLRAELGFDGVLFSDDLEMGAITGQYSIEEAAVEAVWAGCDVVLICADWERQERAHEALVRRAEADRRFRERCVEAAGRSLRLRRLVPPRGVTSPIALGEIVGGAESRAVEEEIARAGSGATDGRAT
jgi:beta-N-acetylhexosaminidase